MVNGSAFPSTLASTGTVMRTLRITVVAERGSNVKLVCNGNNVQPLDTTLKWTFNTHKMTHNGYRNNQNSLASRKTGILFSKFAPY